MCSSGPIHTVGTSPNPTFGDAMNYPLVSDPIRPPQADGKPRLDSFDSGQEFSFEHLAEVCKLVERAEIEDRELNGYVFDDSCLLV